MPEGQVIRSTGSRYRVRADDGSTHDCVAKGNLRIQGFSSTNPVAVGDRVRFDRQVDDHPGAITHVHDRRNYLVRRSVNLSFQKQIIAANLDQAMVMVTIARPRTSTGFIDRFLVTCEAYQIPAVIVFNKVDDLVADELSELERYERIYKLAGYPTIRTSAITGDGVDQIKLILKDKVTLLSGHSGVGKSTLVNCIEPDLDLRTQDVSAYHETGQHTTTFAELFQLSFGGAIIDTPGIKGFGLVDMEASDIADQFPEFVSRSEGCRFSDCVHVNEPGCAVRAGVEAGVVAQSRYQNYLNLVNGIDDESSFRKDVHAQ